MGKVLATLDEALALLTQATNGEAIAFKPGQWEAIDAIANDRRRVLLVQSTGWGKSMVYFISTKIIRATGAGVTLIISPLISLMRNQVETAERLGLRAATINTSNREEWNGVMAQVHGDAIDVLLISPERLGNEEFLANCLLPVAEKIQFLVIDEAHCISDWGHDFRPDYQRIDRILGHLPANVAVLATTATANDRVVQDVIAQLGSGTDLRRGPLARRSLVLQNLKQPDSAARLAWLAKAIPTFAGSGIVYCLTKRDINRVTDWLVSKGISAFAYHADIDKEAEVGGGPRREELERMLLRNEIKVLVATNSLGMGFDKPDLQFVIHFQAPQSIVHYFQQVGRAGRAIETAHGVLMSGHEDVDINDHFISSAFPPDWQAERILNALDAADDGLTKIALTEVVNLRQSQIEKILNILAIPGNAPVIKRGTKWYRTVHPYTPDHARIARLTGQRKLEWSSVQDYLGTETCLMRSLSVSLDDPAAADCGRCANCVGDAPVNVQPSDDEIAEAGRFIKRADVVIKPRLRWQSRAFEKHGWTGNIAPRLRCEEGRALSVWRDAGWGTRVDQEKEAGSLSNDLVDACADMIVNRWSPDPAPTWVCCVPSLRSEALVPDFAKRLAARLGLPFSQAIVKVNETARQREMMNSWMQATNLDGAFAPVPGMVLAGPVLLIDDVVDSRWSLTVIGALLRQAGSGPVLPMALASASAASD